MSARDLSKSWFKNHFDRTQHLNDVNLLVLSHLRWNFVFQRPQHLMTRCARVHPVFFWEEPIFDSETPVLEAREAAPNLVVMTPHLPANLSEAEVSEQQEKLLDRTLEGQAVENFLLWYYTPMGLDFTRQLNPLAVVYDCMDELSGFRGAPSGLRAAESELFAKADLVFTGGRSLYASKKGEHDSVHCFPSSIDREFFATARNGDVEASDQAAIPRPRLGYCGVIDERLDMDLLSAVADLRPDWQIIMLGPVVKISTSDLPQRPNIHYLGKKDYQELPSYLAGWDVGLLPFARNESTRFISPTKTPEYLAAGLPVVSTPIADVVDPYGAEGLVEIAESPREFVKALERAIGSRSSPRERLDRVDQFLSGMSWDTTWDGMNSLIEQVVRAKRNHALLATGGTVAAD